MSYYTKRPFIFVGLPFLSAVVFGTFLLADMRKTRYRTTAVEPRPESTTEKRTLKSLESELEEWEMLHRERHDYSMKPVLEKRQEEVKETKNKSK